ncbi:MAG: histidine kinase, partial [Armatimonadetes bacterium]|nr:histidine kinase [Armatimonadota bacterium]
QEIDERKHAEAERQRLLDQLEGEARHKDEFLAILAHELRNPLAAISNAHYALNQLGSDNRAVTRLQSVIGRQTTKLTRLIDDLLDVSRVSRGKIALQKQWVNLSRILEAAAETCTPLLQQRQHRFTLVLPTRPVWIYGDPTRLEQVVGNLLTNAAKYTEAGGEIRLWSEIEAGTPDQSHGQLGAEAGTAVIRVRDTGIGISPELLPQVFDPFVQAEQARGRAEGGLGIGLALVRDLVRMHGGQVEAASEGHGRGAEFTVRLPATLDDPTRDELGHEPLPQPTGCR